jgi:argininosuccinate lyase
MPFRKAYQITTSIVNFAEKKNKKLNELNIDELKKIEPKLTVKVLSIFNLRNSVNSKTSYGGTSFDNIKKMIIEYKKNLK